MQIALSQIRMSAALAVVLGVGCSSGGSTANTAPREVGPASWTVSAGAAGANEALQGLRFYPSSLTINAGDAVVWSFPSLEPHTVSFPAAGATPVPATDPNVSKAYGGSSVDGSTYVSSGFLAGGATYTLRFSKAGTYHYYSLIHQPVAVGTIVVQKAGSAYPVTPATYASTAGVSLDSDLAGAQASVNSFPFAPGGAHIAAGIAPGLSAGPPANATVMRFMNDKNMMSSDVSVAVGGTLTWTNESNNVPHNVVFPIAGQALPATVTPFDPPSGGSTYDGTTLTNSGVIPPGASYSLTFLKAGTYTYVCAFHDQEHMTGTVTVK